MKLIEVRIADLSLIDLKLALRAGLHVAKEILFEPEFQLVIDSSRQGRSWEKEGPLIPPGADVCITVGPQTSCIPIRFESSEEVANGFICREARAGIEPLLPSASHRGRYLELRPIRIYPGMDLTMEVTNVSKEPLRFIGAFTCRRVSPFVPTDRDKRQSSRLRRVA